MISTKKRSSISLTKDDTKKLEWLKKHYEENAMSVIRRAIALLYSREVNESARNI